MPMRRMTRRLSTMATKRASTQARMPSEGHKIAIRSSAMLSIPFSSSSGMNASKSLARSSPPLPSQKGSAYLER
jgi:hypothetical protein